MFIWENKKAYCIEHIVISIRFRSATSDTSKKIGKAKDLEKDSSSLKSYLLELNSVNCDVYGGICALRELNN